MLLEPAVVVTVNAPEVSPAAIRVLAGTDAGAVLDRVTVAPPVGAGPLKVTVQELVAPPTTDVGLHASEETFGVSEVTVMVPALAVVESALPEELTL